MLKIKSLDSVDALKMAIQCSMDMKEYYDQAITIIKNDDAIAILRGLAEKKEKNRNQLIRTYSRLSGKKILYLNLGKKHKLNSLQRCGSDPNEAIRIAKKNETELCNFYLTISRRLYEIELRQLFRNLALEVEQFIALLESSFVEPLILDQEPNPENEMIHEEFSSFERNQLNSW
jgi:rubrerythrin